MAEVFKRGTILALLFGYRKSYLVFELLNVYWWDVIGQNLSETQTILNKIQTFFISNIAIMDNQSQDYVKFHMNVIFD